MPVFRIFASLATVGISLDLAGSNEVFPVESLSSAGAVLTLLGFSGVALWTIWTVKV